jgi:hypothetical protein
MTRTQRITVCAAVAIIALAALFLLTWDKRQRLGTPGVRVVNVPMPGIDDSLPGTNTFVAGTNSIYLPEKVLAYDSYLNPVTKVVWDWLPKDTTYGQRVYTDTNGFQIQTMVVLMGKDRTSIHKPQYCLTGAGWHRKFEEQTVIAMENPSTYQLPVVRMKLTRTYRGADNKERQIAGVLVYWFVADDQLTSSHWRMAGWMARDLMLTGVLHRWAYIIQFSVCEPGQEEATFLRMSEFIRASVPEYQLVPARGANLAKLLQPAEPTP